MRQGEYEVISAGTTEELRRQVIEKFGDGWELVGGVHVVANYSEVRGTSHFYFYQAMQR